MTVNIQWMDRLQWNNDGFIPVITQEASTKSILMLAWMNREALMKTVESGQAIYWSRARNKLWAKGEESGHIQKVIEIRLDCDSDALLLKVEQFGDIACHTGRHSCFYNKLMSENDMNEWVIADPVLKAPDTIYP
jgi:phosphoribosyl-AMP cyclohydrolase